MPTNTGTGDPNAVITDPTGGAPNFDILSVFKSFGYTPSQSEISALAPAFEGTYEPGRIGTSAVAQYVNFKQAEAQREANDPLAALQTKLQDSVDLNKKQVEGLYGQLQDTLTSAPKLFGDLNPNQITEYLGPLQTAFKAQLASVQGALAGRGLGASSTEGNALAQTGEQFQEQVLSTGLGVGVESQKNKAAAIQNQINALLGLTGSEEGIIGGAAAQRSSQGLGQSNLIASLPYFLDQSAQQQQLIEAQKRAGGGFFDTFGKVTGAINSGVNAFQSLAMVPSQFKTNPPGGSGGGSPAFVPGPNTPANPSGSASFVPAFGPAATPPPPLFA